MGMSGHVSVGPLWACVKVNDCLIYFLQVHQLALKMKEAFAESAFATEHVWSAVADFFFCFSENN
jgi:hypothetical protein